MKIILWVLQVLLALQLLQHGWIFAVPPADLVAVMDAQFLPAFHIFIGVAEILGAVGLVLPGLTRIMPGLTVLAAVGLMIVLGSATIFHLFRGEIENAIGTVNLFCLLGVVAYGRWKVVPFTSRSHTSTRARTSLNVGQPQA